MPLPTDFKNDIMTSEMNGKRQYQMIQNANGTVSFVDVTEYEQEGSDFGAGQINATNEAVNEIITGSKINISSKFDRANLPCLLVVDTRGNICLITSLTLRANSSANPGELLFSVNLHDINPNYGFRLVRPSIGRAVAHNTGSPGTRHISFSVERDGADATNVNVTLSASVVVNDLISGCVILDLGTIQK